MLIITDFSALNAPLPERVRYILDLRRELVGLATFLIVEPGDKLKAIEAAAGFPISGDLPPWEWVLDHGGVFEAPIILNDDGATLALIIPATEYIDPVLLAIAREHAEAAPSLTATLPEHDRNTVS